QSFPIGNWRENRPRFINGPSAELWLCFSISSEYPARARGLTCQGWQRQWTVFSGIYWLRQFIYQSRNWISGSIRRLTLFIMLSLSILLNNSAENRDNNLQNF